MKKFILRFPIRERNKVTWLFKVVEELDQLVENLVSARKLGLMPPKGDDTVQHYEWSETGKAVSLRGLYYRVIRDYYGLALTALHVVEDDTHEHYLYLVFTEEKQEPRYAALEEQLKGFWDLVYHKVETWTTEEESWVFAEDPAERGGNEPMIESLWFRHQHRQPYQVRAYERRPPNGVTVFARRALRLAG